MSLQEAIKNFRAASSALDRAEKILDDIVSPLIGKTNEVHELMSLVQKLPTDYFGSRHIYEKIYEIQDGMES